MTLIISDGINAIGRILALGEFTVLHYLLLWIFWCHYLTIVNVSCAAEEQQFKVKQKRTKKKVGIYFATLFMHVCCACRHWEMALMHAIRSVYEKKNYTLQCCSPNDRMKIHWHFAIATLIKTKYGRTKKQQRAKTKLLSVLCVRKKNSRSGKWT